MTDGNEWEKFFDGQAPFYIEIMAVARKSSPADTK